MKTATPPRSWYFAALTTGFVALVVGGNTILQSLELPSLWRMVPEVLPIGYLASFFWLAISVALLVIAVWIHLSPPPPRGGTRVIPFERPRRPPGHQRNRAA